MSVKQQLFQLNFEKEHYFEHGEVRGKQQGQLETTAFRRVRANSPAHGRNAERKRGVSVLVSGLNINHGLSRTVLADARLEFGRSCFYSCLGCFQYLNLLSIVSVSIERGLSLYRELIVHISESWLPIHRREVVLLMEFGERMI